ncbi:intron-binding protein aquarius [Striga asiatica]|uniref:Intron-binding protein aquarius n=1 Tax=Striga asiatica TaxID=4170 RepID=A0A5A7QF34_STRAF|nr:intron-binding protein aquarius [Striga asiatica]
MTKIYGTGVFDFRRHRVAEYPVAADALPPPEKPAITAGSGPKKSFSLDLVGEIYYTEPRWWKKDNATAEGDDTGSESRSESILGELPLAKFCSRSASFEHVMSMILMVNEKFRELSIANGAGRVIVDNSPGIFRENVAAWIRFYNRKDMFEAFLERVLRLKESLEDEIISERIMRLVSLDCWHSLSYGVFRIAKRAKYAIKSGEALDHSTRVESYCERFMEFLIDLFSQLPTRRLVRPLVSNVAIVSKCFDIDDHQGRQMTDDEVLQAHYKRIQAFQLFTFKKIPKLRELALANVGAINRRSDLAKKLSILSPGELRDLGLIRINPDRIYR